MNERQYLLIKLIEECAEVQQHATKALTFGMYESQAQGPSTNPKPDAVLTAQAIIGLSIMPDKYRRLIDLNRQVCQIGCSAIEWEDLFAEVDASGIPGWEKENVFAYKISAMLADEQERFRKNFKCGTGS